MTVMYSDSAFTTFLSSEWHTSVYITITMCTYTLHYNIYTYTVYGTYYIYTYFFIPIY